MSEILKSIVVDFWGTAAEMSPYLLFGFFMAGVLSVLISPQAVERHLGGRGVWPVVKASAFGVPLPLCSCSVIPVTMSLEKHGASKGAAISFLLSTPQTGVDSIFVTYSLLGPVFAVLRPVAALITGVVGGSLVDVFEGEPKVGSSATGKVCKDECCAEQHNKGRLARVFRYGFVTLPRDIGGPMLVGLIVAAGISAMVPDDFFAETLGTGIGAMLVMMLLGVPVYVCATASVPIAAALIAKGVTPGAALVFLMTGPATNAASLVTIWRQLGRVPALTYLVTVGVSAIVFGLVLDYAAGGVEFEMVARPGWMLPDIVKYVSAAVLLTVLGLGIIAKRKSGANTHGEH